MVVLLAPRVNAQQFLDFPLLEKSVPVWHGWLYDDDSYHGAVDYVQPLRTPVLAAADGIAMASSQPMDSTKDTYGSFVLIKHANSFSTLYAHLDAVASNIKAYGPEERRNSDFSSWTTIKRGDVIGYVGLSGVVTTKRSHLHFEAAYNPDGTYSGHIAGRVDPYDLYDVGTFYPPSGPKFSSCGENFHWLNCPILPREIVYQPGPGLGKDIWTTSVYSYEPNGGGPGGGLDDYELVVGGWGDLYYSLLQFNLTGLPAVTQSAQLQLYCFTQRGDGTTGIDLDRITQFWDWKTQGTGADHLRLWWADQPPTTPAILSALPAPVVGQWYVIDVTDFYNKWQNGTIPNFGLELRPVSNNNRWAEFYSSDYMVNPSLRPKLVIKE